jgi:Tfp pilus assembly protein PilF
MDKIEKLKAYLLVSPKDNFLRHALGLEYIKIGDELAAKSLFEAILLDSPDYVGTYYHLAKLLERLSLTEEAIQWYEKGMDAALKAGDKHAFGELRSAWEELTF